MRQEKGGLTVCWLYVHFTKSGISNTTRP